ncbi:MAG: hypothetical protein JWL60_2660 [Gemmatimonadetes bacterium]|nr:hypothetical protein [Gemmatimonadota bacterium]
MIERLHATLDELARMPRVDRDDPRTQRLLGDCADALRLELDCPQQVLTEGRRAAMDRLSEMLDGGAGDGVALRDAIRLVHRLLPEQGGA